MQQRLRVRAALAAFAVVAGPTVAGASPAAAETAIQATPEVALEVSSGCPRLQRGTQVPVELTVTNPSEMPTGKVEQIHEPVVRAMVLAPSDFVGTIMELCQARRGTLLGMEYLSESRV